MVTSTRVILLSSARVKSDYFDKHSEMVYSFIFPMAKMPCRVFSRLRTHAAWLHGRELRGEVVPMLRHLHTCSSSSNNKTAGIVGQDNACVRFYNSLPAPCDSSRATHTHIFANLHYKQYQHIPALTLSEKGEKHTDKTKRKTLCLECWRLNDVVGWVGPLY